MEIKNILDLQKVDLARKKIKDELAKDANYITLVKSKEVFENAKQKMSSSEVSAEAVVNAYNNAVATLEETVQKVEELVARAGNEDLSEDEQNEIADKLEELRKSLATGEKKTAELKALADKALGEYKLAVKVGKEAREKYAVAKAKVGELQESKEKDLGKLLDARNQLKTKVEPDLYAIYKAKKTAGLLPVFVPVMGEGALVSCGGCGMQQSGAVSSALESKGYCECESCHRLIYKP